MATYILKRRSFAQGTESSEAIEPTDLSEEDAVDINSLPTAERIKALQAQKIQVAQQNAIKSPRKPKYNNSMETKGLDAAESIVLDRNKDLRRTKTVNQNININKTSNINNRSREKAAELTAEVRLQKLKNQAANANGVNSKLIEMQKVQPLKPVSINS